MQPETALPRFERETEMEREGEERKKRESNARSERERERVREAERRGEVHRSSKGTSFGHGGLHNENRAGGYNWGYNYVKEP